jgi:uncharacterized membrane protein
MDSVSGFLFRLICHQLPERSPLVHSTVLPLCFRCVGLCSGLTGAYLWILVTGGPQRSLPPLKTSVCLVVAPLLLGVDGLANYTGLWVSPGWIRTLTGLFNGMAVAMVAVTLLPVASVSAKPVFWRLSEIVPPAALSAAIAAATLSPGPRGLAGSAEWMLSLGLLLFLVNWLVAVSGYFRGYNKHTALAG